MTELEQKFIQARRKAIAVEYAHLNDMQQQGVMTTEGPLLLLAGAGSGKTTVLIHRVANLLRYGRGSDTEEIPIPISEDMVTFLEEYAAHPTADQQPLMQYLCAVEPAHPWEVLAITFTNKAANELKERLERMLGEEARDVWASTFHSACVRILRRDIEQIGYSRDFTIYDTDDSKRVLKDCLKELELDEKTFPVREILSVISRAKDEMLLPEDFRAYWEKNNDWRKTRIAKVYSLYTKKLRDANALDFDDIILLTVQLLQGRPEVREYYQRKFRYVLVDEYQDTNHLQYLLTSLLAGGYQNVVDTFTAAGKPGAMTFYGLGSYGVMAAIALVLSTAMGVIGTPTHRTRIYTSKDEKTARKAFLGQGILLFGWSFVTAIIGMSCFTIATMNGDTLASGDYAFAYMATNALPPIIGMMFMICGLSATMSSGDSDAISGVTILLTDVYPSVTGKTIKEEDYAKYSRIALICTLGAAFFITLFVNDVIGYISTIVGAFLPGVAVAMLLGRFWKRVNWQGGLACIGSGTLLGVLILVLPSFKNWINATMGGPAVPATIISLVFGIVVSLMFPADTTPDDVRLKHVMDDRRGTVVEKVAAAEAAAEEEEDL